MAECTYKVANYSMVQKSLPPLHLALFVDSLQWPTMASIRLAVCMLWQLLGNFPCMACCLDSVAIWLAACLAWRWLLAVPCCCGIGLQFGCWRFLAVGQALATAEADVGCCWHLPLQKMDPAVMVLRTGFARAARGLAGCALALANQALPWFSCA